MGSTFLSLHYHIIFSTKHRAPVIAREWRSRLHEYMGGTVRGLGGVPEAVGGIDDHVGVLVISREILRHWRRNERIAAIVRQKDSPSLRWRLAKTLADAGSAL